MYNSEIQKIMEKYNYNLPSTEYLCICDSSAQIDHIKYSPYEGDFEIWTNDGGYWKFKIHYRN